MFANLSDDLDEVGGVASNVCLFQPLTMFRNKHVECRENKSIERVLFDIFGIPINQFVDIVRRCLEREDLTGQLDIMQEWLDLGMIFCDLVQ